MRNVGQMKNSVEKYNEVRSKINSQTVHRHFLTVCITDFVTLDSNFF